MSAGEADSPDVTAVETTYGLNCPTLDGTPPVIIDEIATVLPAPPGKGTQLPATPDEAIAEKVEASLPGLTPDDFLEASRSGDGAERTLLSESSEVRLTLELIAPQQWAVTSMEACASAEATK
jgi:hypothetical protein